MGKDGSIDDFREFERRVLETVKLCELRKEPILVWAMEVSKCVAESGGTWRTLPSPELGEVVVSQLCSSNNSPSLWKFLHQALSSGLLYPLHVLSLLTSRVIPQRQSQPGVYRLYLELLRRHAFSFNPHVAVACKERLINSIDNALQLSQTYGSEVLELGHAHVLCFFSAFFRLIDSIADDYGLQMTSFDGASGAITSNDSQNMEVDFEGNPIYRRNEQLEHIRTNSFLALEVLAELIEDEKAVVLLRLVHFNMPEKFNAFLQRMQFLDAHKFSSPELNSASHLLKKLSANIQKALVLKGHMSKRQFVGIFTDFNSCDPGACFTSEAGRSACWVHFDVCVENAMDGKHFPVTSAINILADTIRTLQVFNGASWQETFLALWLSALRFMQRERDPLEGPVPHLESRLCILLSITPLAIALVLEDDSRVQSSFPVDVTTAKYMETESRKQGLISSLQVLGMYTALICSPSSIVSAANNAVAKAVSFISKKKNGISGINAGGFGDTIVKAGGDMRHLIVEACVARKLIDTSAYYWPGYVSPSVVSNPDPSPLQRSPWSTFMEGAKLNAPLINILVTTPAPSLAEIEKLYNLALNGPEEERPAAAKILCGASLSYGWNLQEHVVHAIVNLLSPPIPSNFTGSRSHLLDYMPMLSAILFGVTKIDTVHVLYLHGVVPEVAAALFPIIEAFGSLVPLSVPKLGTYDESSVYMVFSSAFLFLLRLWKFYRPPVEQCITGRGGVIGGELTLEYLLLLRNSRIQSDKPIYIDSCPKLRAWYCQNKSCIASTLSDLSSGNPVHQVANKILNMIYGKATKGGTYSSSNTSTSSSMGTTNDSSSITEDPLIPLLPAWELLEAIPYVIEAILTACAHGRLSSRDMTTGLRDLVDFLPASLAAIFSYLSAEVTRGIWKPVLMNGTDWPSPAPNFASVLSEMAEILGAAHINIPKCSSGDSPAVLPLPMAALVSLTITFKLEKNLEYIHAVVGPALENTASICPWPGTAIIGSLWTQKVRRWQDFIVMSCSRTLLSQDQEALGQLLRSCFTSFLGSAHTSTSPLTTSPTGVNGLLGLFVSSRGVHPRIAPGFLYLRTCCAVHNVLHVNDVIVGLVSEFSQELVGKWRNPESRRLKSTRASLAVAIARAKEVAMLGASLLCVAGGPQLVQELYKETMPMWLLSAKADRVSHTSVVSRMVEGYAMAYLIVLSGSLIWGVGKESSWSVSKSSCVIGVHMDFIAGVLDGNICLACDQVTWKAYVLSLVGLLLNFTPAWVREVKLGTLKSVAYGLKGWQECDLALSLLERGGPGAMSCVAEMLV